MKSSKKKALKRYQAQQGNFKTSLRGKLSKEADLAEFYFPGIFEVMNKIEQKPDQQSKYCTLPNTVAVIGTGKAHQYPLLSAKASLLSEMTGLNVIPLLLKYGSPQNLPTLLDQLSPNFRAYYLTDFTPTEREIVKQHRESLKVPSIFQHEALSTAVISAVENLSKALKLKKNKLRITIEGEDHLAHEILKMLLQQRYENITLLDEQGPLYPKRPQMNQGKNDLVSLSKNKKDSRDRETVLAETDIYICTLNGNISSKTTDLMPEKSAIIALKSEEIENKGKQITVSTRAHLPNHLSDLQTVSVFCSGVCEGKKNLKLDKISSAIASYFGSPNAKTITPGILEKNLVKKCLKKL